MKHKVLQNALLNSALPSAPEEDRRDIFFGLIDDFTPSHLRLLSMYNEIRDNSPDESGQKYFLEKYFAST